MIKGYASGLHEVKHLWTLPEVFEAHIVAGTIAEAERARDRAMK